MCAAIASAPRVANRAGESEDAEPATVLTGGTGSKVATKAEVGRGAGVEAGSGASP